VTLLQSLSLHGGENLSVVVVDNRKDHNFTSDDNLLEELMRTHFDSERIIIIRHPHGGLSSARNRGAQTSESEFLYFLDDECLVTRTSMEAINNLMRSGATAAFGGYSDLSLNRPVLPGEGTAKRTLTGGEQLLGAVDLMSGGNLLVRNEAFKSLGGFNEQLGRGSGAIELAEDSEFAFRLLQLPETTIMFDPNMEVFHGARSDKSSIRWRLRESFHKGRAGVFLRPMRMKMISQGAVTESSVKASSLRMSFKSIYRSALNPRAINLIFVFLGAAYQMSLSIRLRRKGR